MPVKLAGATTLEIAQSFVTAFPVTIGGQITVEGDTGTLQVWAALTQLSADRYICGMGSGTNNVYSSVRQPGASSSAAISTANPSSTALKWWFAVFTSTTKCAIYFGDNTESPLTISVEDSVSLFNTLVIGGLHYNGNAASNKMNGSIANVFINNTALSSAQIGTVIAGTKPETLAGHVVLFELSNPSNLSDLTGAYTLAATGPVAVSTATGAMTHSVAPVLSAPTAAKTGSTTASATVSTTVGSGTLYTLFSANPTETAALIKSTGQTQAVTASGTQTVSKSGLAAASTFYAHFYQEDPSATASNVMNSASFTTDPLPAAVLSGAAGAATGTTTATASVSTTIGSGTLWYLFSATPTESAATIKASGVSQAVTAPGTQSVSTSGLTAATQYYSHFVQVANGQDSNVANGAGFTTTSLTAPVLTSPAGTATGTNTAIATVSTNVGSGTLYAYASPTPTELAATVKSQGTMKAVTATGAQSVDLTALTPGTTYYLHFVQNAAGADSGVSNSSSFSTNPLSATIDIVNDLGQRVSLCHAMGGLPLVSEAGKIQFLSKTDLAAPPLAVVSKTTNPDGTITPFSQTGVAAGVKVCARWISDATGDEGYFDVIPT